MLPGTIKSYKLQSFLYNNVTTSGGQHACSQIHVAFHIYKTLWSATNLMKWLSYGLIVTCMGKINLGKQKGRAPRRSADARWKIGCFRHHTMTMRGARPTIWFMSLSAVAFVYTNHTVSPLIHTDSGGRECTQPSRGFSINCMVRFTCASCLLVVLPHSR
jgi:hypothetical protein